MSFLQLIWLIAKGAPLAISSLPNRREAWAQKQPSNSRQSIPPDSAKLPVYFWLYEYEATGINQARPYPSSNPSAASKGTRCLFWKIGSFHIIDNKLYIIISHKLKQPIILLESYHIPPLTSRKICKFRKDRGIEELQLRQAEGCGLIFLKKVQKALAFSDFI